MKRIGIFFAAFLVIASGLFSQEPDGVNENTITAISVSGLKRTKPYVIEKPLQIYIGRDAESIDKNEIIAILKSTGIVEPLSVEIEDNADGEGNVLPGRTLAITVK